MQNTICLRQGLYVRSPCMASSMRPAPDRSLSGDIPRAASLSQSLCPCLTAILNPCTQYLSKYLIILFEPRDVQGQDGQEMEEPVTSQKNAYQKWNQKSQCHPPPDKLSKRNSEDYFKKKKKGIPNSRYRN